MNSLRLTRPVLAVFVGAIWATAAFADTSDIANIPDILRNYRFITSRSTVEVSGGLPVFSVDWNVAGKFGLATGYDGLFTPTPSPTATPPALSGHASFVNVNAYMFHPMSAGPASAIAIDLDKTLNLSGLKGTFKIPNDIHFTGDDGQGIPMNLEAVIRGPLLHLTGATLPVPTCATCGINMYKVDALAVIGPYADINLDGVVNSADLHVLMSHIGMQTGATFEQGDVDGNGAVDGNDFLAWQRSLGAATSLSAFSDLSTNGTAVPEPATFALFTMAVALLSIPRRKRRRILKEPQRHREHGDMQLIFDGIYRINGMIFESNVCPVDPVNPVKKTSSPCSLCFCGFIPVDGSHRPPQKRPSPSHFLTCPSQPASLQWMA